jgi:uncharacterized coiled-coil protein SlyX
MTQTLSMLNMPSRAEVISIAERLVNVEMRLDDLDAKLNTIQKSLQEAMKKTVNDAMTAQNSLLTDITGQLAALTAALNPKQAVAPKPAPRAEKTEPKPQPKAKVANDLTAKKVQEAK